MLTLADLDYELPDALIAQAPLEARDAARMLALDRDGGDVSHRRVRDLPTLLPPALLVVNDTRVMPARLLGQRPGGGKAELLLVERLGAEGPSERWVALARPKKRLGEGTVVRVGEGAMTATVAAHREGGEVEVVLDAGGAPIMDVLERVGRVPLPPYIRREAGAEDRDRYQTVYADTPGAVAAPTAGLHLSERLLEELRARGHRLARVTLHVGPGTFQPVQGDDLKGHAMHAERYVVSEEAAQAIRDARAEGRPVVAVGTTVVRTLESSVGDDDAVRAGAGSTRLFIRPPYRFRVVDALLTNFHLPRSTLLALVMAFGGIEPVRRAYAEAVRERYRFYSYGDAMLIRGGAA
jgi:S-adenosylmethionine:tRNA ribosyltransferase-isomerase